MKTSGGKINSCLGPFATLVERLLDLFHVNGISVVKLLNQMKLDRETEAEREKRRDTGLSRSARSPSKGGATSTPKNPAKARSSKK